MKKVKVLALIGLVLLSWCAPVLATTAIPPHRVVNLPGLHSYSTSVSVPAGGTIEFRTSSETQYTASIIRLGTSVDDPASNAVLYRFPHTGANVQPIQVGSYIHVEKGISGQIKALTLESWIRPWNTRAWAGVITQYDYPTACGYALFMAPNGAVSFYLGDGGYYDGQSRHDTSPDVVFSGSWFHIVATWDGREKAIFINGKEVGRWPFAGPVQGGTAPLRIGSYGSNNVADNFLDADIAMPAVYTTALSNSEIASRVQDRGLHVPLSSHLFACWPLTEETSETVSDVAGQHRDGRIINHATWMIGGPSFNPNVPRFGSYDPKADATRGHGLRLASDDLYDCRWDVTETYAVPADALPGIYALQIDYSYEGVACRYYVTFVVTKNPARPRADVLVILPANTWRAYIRPFVKPVPASTVLISSQSLQATPRAPNFSLYRYHAAGQPTYQMGTRLPWPMAGPYITYGATPKASHLVRANRFTLAWLEKAGYSYDVTTDVDLHLHPEILSGYKAVIIDGHSEYWSIRMYEAVEKYLAAGGNLMALSGNSIYWRISFNTDMSIMEGRKVSGWGAQVGDGEKGEAWHSQDGARGGMMRECGYPAWKLIGLDTYGGHNVQPSQFGPYRADNPTHFLFTTPDTIFLKKGEMFGASGVDLPGAFGHEFDVRLSTFAAVQEQSGPAGASLPPEPEGITLLATGTCNWGTGGGKAFDYFTREVKQKNDLAGEMIWWERPAGGHVFATGNWALNVDQTYRRLLGNVLFHFGVKPTAVTTVVSQKLRADFTGDGKVDFTDFFLFAVAFGQKATEDNAKFDLNGDGRVDLFDFFLFTDEFGKKQ